MDYERVGAQKLDYITNNIQYPEHCEVGEFQETIQTHISN